MGTLWENIRDGVKSGIQTVSEKTDEMTKIGRLKIEIIAAKRDIEKNMLELGGRIFHLIDEDDMAKIKDDQEIKNLVSIIKDLKTKREKLEEKISQVQQKQPAESAE